MVTAMAPYAGSITRGALADAAVLIGSMRQYLDVDVSTVLGLGIDLCDGAPQRSRACVWVCIVYTCET